MKDTNIENSIKDDLGAGQPWVVKKKLSSDFRSVAIIVSSVWHCNYPGD